MDSKAIIEALQSLILLDIDAAHAYQQALGNTENPEVRARLEFFRQDHERHLVDIAAVLQSFGIEPPEYNPEFKGFVIQGVAYLQSPTGTEGALRIMKINEELTNHRYAEALRLDFPADIKDILDHNHSDERAHLAYIDQALVSRIWEKRGVTGVRAECGPGILQ